MKIAETRQYANETHLHIVVRDPADETLLDFELVPLPLTGPSALTALNRLLARHVARRHDGGPRRLVVRSADLNVAGDVCVDVAEPRDGLRTAQRKGAQVRPRCAPTLSGPRPRLRCVRGQA
jgi:hypothetical protein